jgi:hypothetical protein
MISHSKLTVKSLNPPPSMLTALLLQVPAFTAREIPQSNPARAA